MDGINVLVIFLLVPGLHSTVLLLELTQQDLLLLFDELPKFLEMLQVGFAACLIVLVRLPLGL